MKAVNIVLLVLAGALSGALLMKFAQPRRPAVVEEPGAPGTQIAQALSTTQPVADPKPSPMAAPPDSSAEPSAAPPLENPAEPAPAKAEQPEPSPSKPAPAENQAPAPAPQPGLKLRAPHTPPRRVQMQGAPAATASKPAPSVARKLPPPDRPTVAEAAPAVTTAPVATAPSTPPPALPEQPKETPPAVMEPENATPASAPSAPPPNRATLNAGKLIPVRLLDSLSPERNRAGDAFAATLDSELVASGFVIAERGARVEGRVTASDPAAHTMSIELVSVHTSDNQDVSIQTERFNKRAEPDHSNAAAKIGAGAAIGAAVGAIAGGGKGAAIGAGAGGAVGTGDVLLSRRAGNLRSETRLVFRLRAPVTITEQIR